MAELSDALDRRARAILEANSRGGFTVPSPHQYPHQWNWDAAVNAIGIAHYDPQRARREVLALLSGQWREGMVPHIVYHGRASSYFPPYEFWQTERSTRAPNSQTSGITQPPLLASAVRWLHRRHPDADFLACVYPRLLAWHQWFHQQRDADGSGLVCLIHPWESGTDDSPRWLEVLARLEPQDLPPYERADTRHVSPAHRPTQAEYDRYVHLVNLFRRAGYEPRRLLEESPFLVQDVQFNAILYRAHEDLRALAEDLDRPTEEIEGWLEAMGASFGQRFWDEEAGLFHDYDLRAGRAIPVSTAAIFVPLLAGLASQEQAERLVGEHLHHPNRYGRGQGLRYWVTTCSAEEPVWEATRYWRGPVWPVLNWLICLGLARAGYDREAAEVRGDTLELIGESGFYEYFHPTSGQPLGADRFSWSAALWLELRHGELELPSVRA